MYTVNYHDEREESQSTFPPQIRALRLMVKPCLFYQSTSKTNSVFFDEGSEFLCPVCQTGVLEYLDHCPRISREEGGTLLTSLKWGLTRDTHNTSPFYWSAMMTALPSS